MTNAPATKEQLAHFWGVVWEVVETLDLDPTFHVILTALNDAGDVRGAMAFMRLIEKACLPDSKRAIL